MYDYVHALVCVVLFSIPPTTYRVYLEHNCRLLIPFIIIIQLAMGVLENRNNYIHRYIDGRTFAQDSHRINVLLD